MKKGQPFFVGSFIGSTNFSLFGIQVFRPVFIPTIC